MKKLDELFDGLEQDELEALRSQFESHQNGGGEALSVLFEEEYLKVKGKHFLKKARKLIHC